jgi:hypothetical protein
MHAPNTAAGTTGLAERHATCSVDVCHARRATPDRPYAPEPKAMTWRRYGDAVEIR